MKRKAGTFRCRICLLRTGFFTPLTTVLPLNGMYQTLMDIINTIAPKYEANKDDGKPQYLCMECLKLTMEAIAFHIQYEAANQILLRELGEASDDNLSELNLKIENIKNNKDKSKCGKDLTTQICYVCNFSTNSDVQFDAHCSMHRKVRDAESEAHLINDHPVYGEILLSLRKKDFNEIRNDIINLVRNKNLKESNSSTRELRRHKITYKCDKCDFVSYAKAKFQEHCETHNLESASSDDNISLSSEGSDVDVESMEVDVVNSVETKLQEILEDVININEENRLMEKKENQENVPDTAKKHKRKAKIEVRKEVMSPTEDLLNIMDNNQPISDINRLNGNTSKLIAKKKRKTAYSCDKCDFHTNSKLSLDKHTPLCEAAKELTIRSCSFCDFKADSINAISNHTIKEHSDFLTFTCENCDRKFLTKNALTDHLSTHFTHLCYVCNKRFENRQKLLTHYIYDHGKSFKCPFCREVYATEEALNTHKTECRSLCDKNEKLKLSKEKMREQTHPFECELCGDRFKWQFSLMYHVTKHTGYLKLECETCKLEFSSASRLRIHTRQHTNEKPFSCKVCQIEFMYLSSFYKHMGKIHNVTIKIAR